MNYRYGILATALAVGLFAVPATAGVTDVTGGSTTTVNTTVRNNYTDTRTNVTNEKHLRDKVVNKTVDKSGGTKYIVKGTVTYYGKINGNSDHRSETKTYEYTTTNPSDIGTLQGRVSSNLRDYGFDRQKNRYGVTSGELNTMYHLNNSKYMGSSYEYSDWSSSKSGSVKTSTSSSRQKNTTNKYTEYKENKSKMTTTYDGSKLTYTGTTYEPGTILVGDKVVAFDFFGNGFPVLTEWVGANDGLLCRPNADGSVKGTNLFGIANGFDNGYEEMASLDVDNSGSLEGAELKELRVWTDVNANGIAEANELKTLDELGITSIKVSHNNYASTFVRNGQTFKSFDWWPNCREMRKVDMASVIK